MSATATPETKLCTRCCDPKPLDQYRSKLRGSGVTASWCNGCHAEVEKERRLRKRRGVLGGIAGELAAAKDAGEAQRACKVALAAFRGPVGFAKTLWSTFEAAERGSPSAVKLLLGMMNLYRLVSPPPPDYSQMSDEDLQRKLKQFQNAAVAKARASMGLGG